MDHDGTIYSEDFDKANVLNQFFCKQTMLIDENVSLPELPLFDGVGLSNIVVTCYFVLFDLILYVPSTIFQLNRDGSSWVEPVLS